MSLRRSRALHEVDTQEERTRARAESGRSEARLVPTVQARPASSGSTMLTNRLLALALSVGAILILGWPVASSASEPSAVAQPIGVDLRRLDAELDLFAAQERRTRVATAVTGLSIGSALVPTGIVLVGRTDGVSQALVIGMIVGGSAQLLAVPLAFIPSKMDDMRVRLHERIVANADREATVRAIEIEWRAAAGAARSKRKYAGTTMAIVGSLSLSLGLTFLLAPQGVLGMSRKTQYTVGGVIMGVGIPVTTIGVRFLLEWSPEETAWEAYRAMKADVASPTGRSVAPTIALVPTSGGALAFVTVAF